VQCRSARLTGWRAADRPARSACQGSIGCIARQLGQWTVATVSLKGSLSNSSPNVKLRRTNETPCFQVAPANRCASRRRAQNSARPVTIKKR